MADVGNVQAIVARSSAKPLISVLLFRFGPAATAKAFLREWTTQTPAGLALEGDGQPALHFLFSWKGLATVLRGHPQLDVTKGQSEFEVFFVDPAEAPDSPALAESLGLLGINAPEGWWERRFKTGDIDLALHASFDTADQQADVLARLRRSATDAGLQELQLTGAFDGALSGCRPADGRLHFGYRDGVTTPRIDWDETGANGDVNLREFVVGYPNQQYRIKPLQPGPWQEFARDGSYVGLCWLHQDVARFNQFLRDNAPQAPPNVAPALAEEWVAAKVMGRWRDGSPLMKFPHAPPVPPQLKDDFGYATDPDGVSCPVAAHIRVANLRDQQMSFPNQIRFPNGPPRFIRRGFSYGPPLEGVEDDGKDRGVVGLFFFARVNEQFYTILRWMQKTDFSDAFEQIPNGSRGQDALVGAREDPKANTKFHVPLKGGGALSLQLADFVRYRGVAVLFAPSMKSLAVLSAA